MEIDGPCSDQTASWITAVPLPHTAQKTKAISSAAQQALNTPENVLGTTTISVSAGNTALAQSDQLLAAATKNLYLTDYASVQAQTLVTYLKNYTEQYNNTLQKHTSDNLN